jgi:Tfp pilus assembly protein PilF
MRDLQAPEPNGTKRYLRAACVLPVLAVLAAGTHYRVASLPAVRAQGLAEGAVIAMRAKEWTRARQSLDEAISIDPGNARPRLYRALLIAPAPGEPTTLVEMQLLLGNGAGARKVADKVVSLAPKDPTAYLQRAAVCRAAGDLQAALLDQDRAVALEPDIGAWHAARAWTLLELGQFGEASTAIDRALALAPDAPRALGTRCWIHVSMGDQSAARADCEGATSLQPAAPIDRGMLAFLGGKYAAAAAQWTYAGTSDRADEVFLRPWIEKAETAATSRSESRR